MQNQPVSFPEWKKTLAHANFSDSERGAYEREVITFLKHCKTLRAPATVGLAKQYVEHHERTRTGPVRLALRWFFQTARGRDGRLAEARATGPVPPARPRGLRPMEPKPAKDDAGGPAWEQALVKTMRLRGLLWRTEYTYRR